MRKIQEILRLQFDQKLGQQEIAGSANVSQSTVHVYLARMSAAGLRWPLDQEWDEDRLQQALFPPGQAAAKVPCEYSPILSTSANSRAHACVEDIDYRAARGLDKTLVRSLIAESAWVAVQGDRHLES